jgi:hypothetical protein
MSVIAQLGLDASGFLASIAASKAALFGFQAAANTVMGADALPEERTKQAAAGIAASIVALTVAMTKGTQAAIKFGASLVDVSYDAGLAVDQTMALNLAVEKYGISSSAVVPATEKFNAAVRDAANGTGPLVGILNNAGISMDALGKMDTATRMQTVAEAIKAIKHPTEQAQAAMAIWGKEGIKFNEALQPGKINDAAAALGLQAQLMAQNAGVFARISQIMAQSGSTLSNVVASAKNKIQGFFVGVASGLAPEILSILESVASGSRSISDTIKEFVPALSPLVDTVNKLMSIDFASIGLELGKAIASAFELVRSLNFKDIFKARTQEEARAKMEANREAAIAANPTPEKNVPVIGMPTAAETRFDLSSQFSSLQRVGGGSALLSGGQDNSPAYQSVRIQEDIRTYIKQLIDVVKQGGQDYQIAPAQSGNMVLTA